MPDAVYTIRRKVFALFGAQFHIYNAAGALIGYSKQKAFKLKEDIRIYTDETMSEERATISARSILDFSAAYDVVDSKKQQKVGALRRKGLTSSFLKDSWIVMDPADQQIGAIEEDSLILALIRKYALNIIPQKFHLRDSSGDELAEFRTHFNPFIHRMTVTVFEGCPISPILVLAA
jgi:uncharacterized protein YxjI